MSYVLFIVTSGIHNNIPPKTFCLKNCISHHNSGNGISVYGNSVINIHGDATAVHSNGRYGIFASNPGSKVLIHLSSHHNTCYNNTNYDRWAQSGGTITNVEE